VVFGETTLLVFLKRDKMNKCKICNKKLQPHQKYCNTCFLIHRRVYDYFSNNCFYKKITVQTIFKDIQKNHNFNEILLKKEIKTMKNYFNKKTLK